VPDVIRALGSDHPSRDCQVNVLGDALVKTRGSDSAVYVGAADTSSETDAAPAADVPTLKPKPAPKSPPKGKRRPKA